MHVVLSAAKDPGICFQANAELLRGVYPERTAEVLRFAQDDMRRAQHDKIGFFSDLLGAGRCAQAADLVPNSFRIFPSPANSLSASSGPQGSFADSRSITP